MVAPALWRAMATAPRIALTAPADLRAAYLVSAYRDIVEDRAALDTAMARLPTPPGRKRLEEWRGLADAGDFHTLALALMDLHYDPAYRRSSRKGRPAGAGNGGSGRPDACRSGSGGGRNPADRREARRLKDCREPRRAGVVGCVIARMLHSAG